MGRLHAVVLGVMLACILASAAPALAQASGSTPPSSQTTDSSPAAPTSDSAPPEGVGGPALSLDKTSVDPGESVTIVFAGFTGRLVTVSICGNLAKRGSADCNMPASQGVRLYHLDTTPLTSFAVSTPPASCPCVIRASSDNGEVAYAPIEVRGVAVGPVVDPQIDDSPIAVSVRARPAPKGILGTLKSWLGGATPYAVDVVVQNKSSELYSTIAVHGTVGRNSSVDLAGFDMQPGAMSGGQNWTGTAYVDLPTAVIGNYTWHVIASGAGPVTETTSTTKAVPWLLVVLILAFVGDVVAIWVRWVKRRRARKATVSDRDGPEDDPHWSDLPPPPDGSQTPGADLVGARTGAG